jgi:imidazoleglycerol-phosphate dehydratase
MKRTACIRRETTETRVAVTVGLEGGPIQVRTTIPFFDHMLTLMARHGLLGLEIEASGDTEIDLHHTVEDVGITLGQALGQALGDRAGIRRYGQAGVPMDEALATVHIDLVTRPYLVYNVPTVAGQAGGFDVDLAEQFFRALVTSLQATVHLSLSYGSNQHHILEALFRPSVVLSARRSPPMRASRARCRRKACSNASGRAARAALFRVQGKNTRDVTV